MPGRTAPGASADCGASIGAEPAGDGGAGAGVCAHEASRKRAETWRLAILRRTQSTTVWLPLQPRHDRTARANVSAARIMLRQIQACAADLNPGEQ